MNHALLAVIILFLFPYTIQIDSPIPPFIDVTQSTGINATHRAIWDPDNHPKGYLAMGQAWGDYDNDGWLDLYVTGNLDPNVLYHNNGDGTFTESPLSPNVSLPDVPSGGAVWADYDNDGWIDLYVLNQGANVLFRNDQGVALVDVTAIAGVGDPAKGTTATWGDYDSDSWLDLYVVNWACSPECGEPDTFEAQQDRLYHNNGDGTFSDVTHLLDMPMTLGAGFSATFTDYDNDGDADIYVVNDRLHNPIGNVLWRNNGTGCGGWCWSEVAQTTGANQILNGMGLAIGDYDNDLDFDFYFSELTYEMILLQNQGNSTFEDRGREAGVAVNYRPDDAVGWGTGFIDYDNDGWLDLFLATTGFQQDFYTLADSLLNPHSNYMFHNNGDGTFEALKFQPTPTMGVAYADYDEDGWVDIVIGNWNEGFRLLRNASVNNHNWLTVRLIGSGPVNRNAIGARVLLTKTDGSQQIHEVQAGSGLGAGHDLRLHFGLGTHIVHEVKVFWPDGTICLVNRISENQIIDIIYDTCVEINRGGLSGS